MANRRFITTLTFYSYGKTPQEAFNEAKKIADRINGEHDNQAEIEQFHENNYGKLITEKMDVQKLKDVSNG